ncbi:CxxxxCH/CxxCH domain c-type cytochrome [Geomonas anaerohicana]|uniref:CxxxxCH/CxxCH domain-containing protein n=1 Tax=Geomonas anaerohicana TaxID=2798583 RepID=A0ABS0YIR2_9BACT|nr:CxxxxCH/CxxCH domain-containing protein [Geomonas anaerohicana]MBJ6752231.1 CxxxxCH/CxxCH domain-containing protein [Geomonas anaerohicana]
MLNVFKEKYGKILLVAGAITACAGIPGKASALTCVDCHGNPPVDNASRVGGTTGQFPGSHNKHAGSAAGQYGYACTKCHVNNTAANHSNGNIDMAVPLNGNTGASYGKGSSFPVSNNTLAGQACSATYCHSDGTSVATGGASTGSSPNWGTTGTTCTSCHGSGGTTGAPAYVNVRVYPSASPVSTGWTTPANAYADDNVYAVYNTTTQQPLVLTGFNTTAAGLTAGDTITGISVTVHGLAASGLINVALTKTGTATAVGTAKTATLPTTDGTVMVNTTPTDLWGTTWTVADLQSANFGVIIKDNDTTASNIQIDSVTVVVHTAAEPKMNSHASHTSKTCDVCHNATTTDGTTIATPANHAAGSYSLVAKTGTTFTYAYNAAGSTCSTVSCHGNAIWGVSVFNCVTCHNGVLNTSAATQALGGPTTRRNVVAEMKSTWSHKRSSSGGTPANTVVNPADCIVCHMEGDKTTGKTTAVHGNGYINLRDPDTGNNIKNVTWNGATPGAYVEGTTDVQFTQFRRDLSQLLESDPNWLIIAAIQQNHCLKCHDANGAQNANAQVPTTGTAMQPFGVAITGHVAPYNSNGAGNVVNVVAGFTTTNASYHPVIGKQNNSYVQGAQMLAPYSNITKTNGNNTSYGALISCWDCHATLGQTGVQTATVTAHGGAVTLRGPIRAAGTTTTTNLCINCHATKYATTGSQHGTGSAFTVGKSNMGTTTFNNCSYCHGYGVVGATYSATSVARPQRMEEAHGFNDRVVGTVGSKWSNGNRPYAFIRNTLSGWAPKSAVGDTITNPSTCTGTGGTCNNNMSNSSNGLGGVY